MDQTGRNGRGGLFGLFIHFLCDIHPVEDFLLNVEWQMYSPIID